MSNLVNPTFDIPGYANIRYTEATPGELRFLDGPIFGSCVLDLAEPTVVDQTYRLAGTITGLEGTNGNTGRIYFTTPGGNSSFIETDGPFEILYTAALALDYILPRSTSRTIGSVRNLVHELHEVI